MIRALVLLAATLIVPLGGAVPIAPAAAQTVDGRLYVIDGYYPERDPHADLELAIQRARVWDKRILIVVGGGWCVWCHVLDRFLATDTPARQAMAETFVILKVNWSRENRNEAFLAQYPESPGYPDFIILDADGRFLGVQDTGELEESRSYSRERMIAFARRWRPEQAR